MTNPKRGTKELLKNALIEIKKMRAKVSDWENNSAPIAIVGMSCRFANGIDTPEKLWQMLVEKKDMVTEVPKSRWDIDQYYDPDPNASGKTYSKWGSFVDNVSMFDANFFGIVPNEAKMMDPQQRLILETAWEALEYGGQAPDSWKESLVGVFLGISNNDYERIYHRVADSDVDVYSGTGNTFSVASGRLSFLLGFQGPNVAIDTACSSSLVTVHMACQSLRNKECNMALAGGVNLILSPEATIYFSKVRMMSPDGQCKTFDADANGYVRGEGCGFVVLKRLDDAVKNRDNILAVIRGSAVNHDGKSSGLTVPNGVSQQLVIRNALNSGKVSPSDVSYIECHGTGTPLGDPIEIQSLAKVLGRDKVGSPTLKVGSIKTNIGHLEAAAGIAGLLKTILSLQNKYIPAHLHLKKETPHISWDKLSIEIVKNGQDWSEKKKIAGVSSFGFSGTNAHIVLEEADDVPIATKQTSQNMFVLSAKTKKGLDDLCAKYTDYLTTSESNVSDICYTTQSGRNHLKYRLATVGKDNKSILASLEKFIQDGKARSVFTGKEQKNSGVVFMFTGQGSQYTEMGRELYKTHPHFRKTIDECAKHVDSYLPEPLQSILYDSNSDVDINNTAVTQPLLFCIEYALAELWRSWGIEPTVVMGHSVGEYVAACVAGVFSLPDAIKLISMRGRLMQELPQDGSMLAVFSDENSVLKAINDYKDTVSIAAINGPKNTLISGNSKAIVQICENLKQQGIDSRELTVSHAFHSPLMKPMLEKFDLSEIKFSNPKMTIISNVTGHKINDEIATPEYWQKHIMAPVRFHDVMEYIYREGYTNFIEIGPSPTLIAMAKRFLLQKEIVWLPSLRSSSDDGKQILQSLGQLYVNGFNINWNNVVADDKVRRVALPTYAFQRKPFWLDVAKMQKKLSFSTKMETTTDVVIPQSNLSDCYTVEWRKTKFPSVDSISNKNWLLFAEGKESKEFSKHLENAGHNVTMLEKGDVFKQISSQSFVLPIKKEDVFPKMWKLFEKEGDSFDYIVYFWGSKTEGEKIQQGVENTNIFFRVLTSSLQEKLSFTPNWWIITEQVCPIDNNINVSQSPLHGMMRGFAAEHREWVGGILDIDSSVSSDLLENEIIQNTRDVYIALRNKNRYEPHVKKHEVAISKMPLVENEVYMITGGLGSIGFGLAKKFIEKGFKNLILLDCSTPSSKQEEKINSWKSNVQCLVCDISDETSVKDIFANNTFSNLKGIINAAGIAGDGVSLKDAKWEAFVNVMRPKIEGSWNLSKYAPKSTKFVHFSSILTLYGVHGQSSYSAANAFLDALSHKYKENHLSINWGAWASEGMAVESGHGKILEALGMNSFGMNDGFSILENAIATQKPTQILAANISWNKFMLQFREGEDPKLFAEIINETRKNIQKKQAQKYQQVRKTSQSRLRNITQKLKEIASDLFGVEMEEIEEDASFLDMGGDSFIFIQIAQLIGEEFAVTISLQELLEDVSSLTDLAIFIENKLPEEENEFAIKTAIKNENVTGTDLEKVLHNQMLLMSQHLDILRSEGVDQVLSLQHQQLSTTPSLEFIKEKIQAPKTKSSNNTSSTSALFEPELSSKQQEYLDDFIKRYCKKTQKSKQKTFEYKNYLADRRSYNIFRMQTKELVYPIIAEKSKDAYIWDIDGEKYVDISMGFGVHLFGHGASFIEKAILGQLKKGIQVGPQASLANEVAYGISKLTGNERVAFCNSGTEAVMYSLRLARTVAGRRKIVIFDNSYHGTFDSVLAYRTASGKTYPSQLALGIPKSAVEDIIVLEYGATTSLEFIEKHKRELAGVLIEPIRSRSPQVQPREFIHTLRKLTEENNIALIFDEVLVGFRIQRGGAQQWFDVQADIVTYGKIIGGGMPIGVVAGKAKFLDAVDGGSWQPGDESAPDKPTTFLGGTFSKNSLTMATSHAVIKYLEEKGDALYAQLNTQTTALVNELNSYFETEDVPIKVAHGASIFRFLPKESTGLRIPIDVDLFFHHMNYHGVYIWEGRVCFLSTAHTKKDISDIIEATKKSVTELRSGGFLLKKEAKISSKIQHRQKIEKPKLRLFCFPYAGGGASLFRNYHKGLPNEIEVCPIQYPGRENLRKENPIANLTSLVDSIFPDIQSMIDVPFAFFGYSMGALVAFEMIRKLRRENLPIPKQLIVAAHRAPHLPDSTVQIHQLNDEEMVGILQKNFTDVPKEIWENKEMLDVFLPVIRADVTISETYLHKEEEALNCPIFACGGFKDEHISQEEIMAWTKQTKKEFSSTMFPGNHFFIHSEEEMLQKTISGILRGIIKIN